ncbi:Pus3 [Acrasis kona]|uniref:tRNA pseudouridine synthase n=1 Tax=Acrasis kona TaxID=1008807 RepID=A0AAW2YUP7_9EUKA
MTIDESNTVKKPKKIKKEFDFSKHPKRHVALKIAYIGFNYQGFASQTHVQNTVENKIFEALLKVKLISDPNNCKYTRCGRTDSGVSAFGQVIGIQLRSSEDDEKPFDYVRLINNVLPEDIRAIAWSFVDDDFDARFDCLYRTYKYFFVKSNLIIERMREASKLLIGSHDFRNFCKINADQVISFNRIMLDIQINKCTPDQKDDDPDSLYEIIICGYSFLWHQVRCMVAVLFLVGERREDPSIILELLNVEKNPRKPQFAMASEIPLILFDCAFENVKFHADSSRLRAEAVVDLESHFVHMFQLNSIKTKIIQTMMNSIRCSLVVDEVVPDRIVTLNQIKTDHPNLTTRKGPRYVPLMERLTGKSVEEKRASKQNKKTL